MTTEERLDELFKDIPDIKIKGCTYIKYPKNFIDNLKSEFVKIVDIELGTDFHSKGSEYWHRRGVMSRYIDDNRSKALTKRWFFFTCMDDEYRRWEQPYYTGDGVYEKHKHEAVCVNDKHPELIRYFRSETIDMILGDG